MNSHAHGQFAHFFNPLHIPAHVIKRSIISAPDPHLWMNSPIKPKPTTKSYWMNTLMNKKETHLPIAND